jgi:acetylornithine deacetylase/succinyl-diaminopimelate desuccinylase-like protein
MSAARDHWESNAPSIVRDFGELVSIPNVAEDRASLTRVADWIVDAYEQRDITVRAVSLPGVPPAIVGRIPGDGSGPTIGMYAHYDGQPVAPDRWASPPFEATLRSAKLEAGGVEIELPIDGATVDDEWRIYARGTSDDRAPIVALLAAIDSGVARRADIVFLFEGEEEVGSVHLGDYLALLREELAADLWLICDGPVHQSGRSQVALGVRGFAELEIGVVGPPHDLRRGHYGETAINPAVALAELIVSMRDASGNIVAAGLDGPSPPAAAVVAAGMVPDPDNLGFRVNPEGSYATRLLSPLINVRGMASADVGVASRNVIPASAIASIDLRLVAGQDPTDAIDAVKHHISSQGFHVVAGRPTDAERLEHRLLARVVGIAGYPGVRSEPDDPYIEKVVEVVRSVADHEPVLLPSFGGSVPLHHFVEHLNSPLAILPIANHDNNQHSENENIRLGNLRYGVEVFAGLLGMGGVG